MLDRAHDFLNTTSCFITRARFRPAQPKTTGLQGSAAAQKHRDRKGENAIWRNPPLPRDTFHRSFAPSWPTRRGTSTKGVDAAPRRQIEGKEIRTVDLDPERAHFVQLAFELYATGEYSLADMSDELHDRGLRTRPTKLHPAKQISINKLSQMLRDRYYLGYVTYEGEEIKGRHEPLIDEDLFDRVQGIIEHRSTAKERRRVHHHYLKGSLLCGRCQHDGRTGRMILQNVVNSKGDTYTYFFCRNKQDGSCDAPRINVLLIEDAIEAHYARLRFSASFIADVRAHIAEAIGEEEAAARLLHQQLTHELRALDTREDNLIDLAADNTIPQAKIKTKLPEIESQRRRLTERLNDTNDDLSDSTRLIETCLKLLDNPYELYRRCDNEQRRLLSQTIFHGIYIDEEKITDHELRTLRAPPHRPEHSPARPGRQTWPRHHRPKTPVRPSPPKETALLR